MSSSADFRLHIDVSIQALDDLLTKMDGHEVRALRLERVGLLVAQDGVSLLVSQTRAIVTDLDYQFMSGILETVIKMLVINRVHSDGALDSLALIK